MSEYTSIRVESRGEYKIIALSAAVFNLHSFSPPQIYTMGCLVEGPPPGGAPGPGVAPPAGVPMSAIFIRTREKSRARATVSL